MKHSCLCPQAGLPNGRCCESVSGLRDDRRHWEHHKAKSSGSNTETQEPVSSCRVSTTAGTHLCTQEQKRGCWGRAGVQKGQLRLTPGIPLPASKDTGPRRDRSVAFENKAD